MLSCMWGNNNGKCINSIAISPSCKADFTSFQSTAKLSSEYSDKYFTKDFSLVLTRSSIYLISSFLELLFV